MKYWLLAATLLCRGPAAAAAAGPAALLPQASGELEFVQPKYDDKAVAIGNRMAAAVGQGKQPGVTKAEQDYMQAKLKSPALVKVAVSSVTVRRQGDDLHIRIAAPGAPAAAGLPGDAAPGTGLVYNTVTGELRIGRTQFGKPRVNEGKTPLDLVGKYVPGFEWTLKNSKVPTAFVHVGRIPNQPGKCLLNLSVMTDPTSPAFGSYRYDCP